jgi:hypothetical protein
MLRHSVDTESHGFNAAIVAKIVKAQTGSLTRPYRNAPLQIRQSKGPYPIPSVGSTQQAEEGCILAD